ncbi:MAG TPA: type II secretion system minor pseudopilin GspK [Burkholderiaceae bacterium]|nr:type II secretion system minor pseudopilin GspK [Burkholderiaceae bacterium]
MRRRRQQGAAIISAMLVVALAATVVSAMYWREHVAVRSIENRLALAQTRWIERAVLDWARVILANDARSGEVDHFGETWAVPVADTRLDETVTAGAKIADPSRSAMLAGQMIDAQARLNLNSLVAANGAPVQPQIDALRKLLTLLGQPESFADTVLARVRKANPPRSGPEAAAPTALPLTRLADLLELPGIDAEALRAIEPFVVVLPANTRINVNTAPAEVLAAAIADLELSAARRFVARREGVATGFRTLDEAKRELDGTPVLDPQLLHVGSQFFLVRGMVRYDRVESQTETLLQREGGRVSVIWQHRY